MHHSDSRLWGTTSTRKFFIKTTRTKTLTIFIVLSYWQGAPNLGALIGDIIAARLISHAGSLTNLAKYPASTVQILGAEKALFAQVRFDFPQHVHRQGERAKQGENFSILSQQV